MEKNAEGARFSARGRRYSPAERAEILKDAEQIGPAQAADRHGCCTWSIYNWRKQEERAARRQAESDQERGSGAADESLEDSSHEERHRLILELWRQQPGLGPSQIRNLLKRQI